MKKILIIVGTVIIVIGILMAAFFFFFDQAVLLRSGTFYRANIPEKVVAITFDDGPSPVWTPAILDALDKAGVKATFFMLGEHVQKYPKVAKLVVERGHEIANHSMHHNNFIYYDKYQVEKDIKDAEKAILVATGVTTHLFRPPKAWLSKREKKKIREFGYEVVLWTLNSKDWVNFDDKYIVRYLVKNVRPGDIILFHDSGGFFKSEEGNRVETVNSIPRLVEKLKGQGYRFVTVGELLRLSDEYAKKQ